MKDSIAAAAARAHQAVMAQREEVLQAFVAQHGCLPDEAVQIEQRMADGSLRWWIERRTTEAGK